MSHLAGMKVLADEPVKESIDGYRPMLASVRVGFPRGQWLRARRCPGQPRSQTGLALQL
ncbi:hypothetical protein [Streptomyces sp. NPDC058457]|uniref:hypothetical protein n=1 Tax=Streptomyces sp. NPDC058457 TaxID=3346507 RepID=UPI0036612F06